MKKSNLLTIIALLISIINAYGQQNECKVLLPAISQSYDGVCKKGLAHGYGEAKGVDTYVGYFQKGFPEGKGIYTWQNGDVYDGQWLKGQRSGAGTLTKSSGEEKVLTGYWENDEYKGKEKIIPYKVGMCKNVGGVRIVKLNNTDSSVTIKVMRNGTPLSCSNVEIESTNGSVSSVVFPARIENVLYPVQVKMNYRCMNKMTAIEIACEVQFEINESGRWEVIINS